MDTLFFVLKYLLTKTKKEFRHYHDFLFELQSFLAFLKVQIPKTLKKLKKLRRGSLKFDCKKNNSRKKEEEEKNPKQN